MIGDVERDEINRQIMNYVWGHPDATVAEIGTAVGLKREAAQKRITKLYATGKIKRQLVVDLDALGFPNRFRVDVKLSPSILKDRAKNKTDTTWKEIKKVAEKEGITNDQVVLALELLRLGDENVLVEDAAVILGDPADLTLTVRTKELRIMFDFITAKLRPVSGVVETATCIESWSIYRDPGAIKCLETLTKQDSDQKQRPAKQTQAQRKPHASGIR